MRRVYSIEELREFRGHMKNSADIPSASVLMDGVIYSNDWGFGLEAVDKFLDILERMEEKDETALRAPMSRSDKTLEE